MKVLKYQWLTLIWLCVILVLCFGDVSKVSDGSRFFVGFDKLVHLGFFFVLTVFLLFGFLKGRAVLQLSFFDISWIILFSAFVGAGIEVIQYQYFPYRSAEMWDFVCDMLGCSMAIFGYLLFLISQNYVKKS